ncbi:uncharacterized protein NPIL_140131 [Nephila pilipes]|uniref:Uncharacterized protein n=1 Tax=Nephila pilipes TaxID=299642 RepID=A0A8X6UNV2_NEPPI|nr:uncharacterized protein NPIL_140131 [Nephila pilipes]
MYVDDWITGQDSREEALLISLHAEDIMKEAGMEMRKWISNDTTLMSQWAAEGTDFECPELNEEEYFPELKSKDSKENVVLTLNLNQTIFDYLLNYSNRFLTTVRVLSFLFRFVFNCKNPGNKKEGPLTSEEMMEAEYFLLKQEQLGSFHTEITAMQNEDDICHKSKILNLLPFLDG